MEVCSWLRFISRTFENGLQSFLSKSISFVVWLFLKVSCPPSLCFNSWMRIPVSVVIQIKVRNHESDQLVKSTLLDFNSPSTFAKLSKWLLWYSQLRLCFKSSSAYSFPVISSMTVPLLHGLRLAASLQLNYTDIVKMLLYCSPPPPCALYSIVFYCGH